MLKLSCNKPNASFQLNKGDGSLVEAGVRREAVGLENIGFAIALGKNGDYTAEIKKLLVALEALPDHEGAKQLLADFRLRESEQIERQKFARLNSGNVLFNKLGQSTTNAELFEKHELKTRKPVREAGDAITDALKLAVFPIKSYKFSTPETFVIEATQELMTVLATSAGRREFLIVGAQTKDDETQILFEVVEYKIEAIEKFSIGNLIGTPVGVNYIPIHESKISAMTEKLQAKVREGVSNITARIEGAIGKSTELQPPAVPSANSLNPLVQ